MTDPKRHLLKLHGSFNQVIPEIAVHPRVFFAIGHLVGRAFTLRTGLSFAFHPKCFEAVIMALNVEDLEKLFNECYKEELGILDLLLTFVGSNAFEDIVDYGFASPTSLQVTTETGVRNFLDLTIPKSKVEKIFEPKSDKDIAYYVNLLRKKTFDAFKDNIASFRDGLSIYIKTDLLRWVNETALKTLFSPTPDINIDSLLVAFDITSGNELYVDISQEDIASIDQNEITITDSADPGTPSRISVIDAFKIAVKRLDPKLFPGLIGQITGSNFFGNLKPKMFKVIFYKFVASRSLLGEGPSSGERVELPVAASWYSLLLY